VFKYRDLLRIYALVLGASLIVFVAFVITILTLSAADPLLIVGSICLGLPGILLGGAILYLILQSKDREKLTYSYPTPADQPPVHDHRPTASIPSRGYPGMEGPPGHGYPHAPYSPPPPWGYPSPPVVTSTVSKLEIPGLKFLLITFIAAIVLGALALSFEDLCFLFLPAFIIAFSFPSLIWITYVYSKDVHETEPGRAVLTALTWGMLSVIPALVINSLFGIMLPLGLVFLVSVVSAPLVEEFVKPIGLQFVRREIGNELDGLIYGVTCGMGFAMMENLFYEIAPGLLALFTGNGDAVGAWTATAFIRGLASTLGHAVGAGIIGYAYAAYIHRKVGFEWLLGAYLAGVGLHAGWNGSLFLLEITHVSQEMDTVVSFSFMALYPIMEFIILRHFLERARKIDQFQFGAGGPGKGPPPDRRPLLDRSHEDERSPYPFVSPPGQAWPGSAAPLPYGPFPPYPPYPPAYPMPPAWPMPQAPPAPPPMGHRPPARYPPPGYRRETKRPGPDMHGYQDEEVQSEEVRDENVQTEEIPGEYAQVEEWRAAGKKDAGNDGKDRGGEGNRRGRRVWP